MTTVSATGNTAAATSSSKAVSGNGAASLSFKDYISLLTTQLKYQDPTAPTDNSQMVAQMAQFSTLSGISQLNNTSSAISSQLGSLSDLSASVSNISTKLDALIAAQKSSGTGSTTA